MRSQVKIIVTCFTQLYVLIMNLPDDERIEILSPLPNSQGGGPPLSAVCDCLFNIVISALHIWRPPSPFTTLGGTMLWQLGPTYSCCYPHVWRPSPPFTTLGQQCHGDWDPLVVAATLHIWRPSPPFVTLGCIMPWWMGPTYDLKPVVDLDFILRIIVVTLRLVIPVL